MKYITYTILVLTCLLTIYSCTQKEGAWDDNIELSAKEVILEGTADSVEITTQGEGWWITNIELDDVGIDFSDINTTKDVFEIQEEAFSITRNNSKSLTIMMNANPNNNQRTLDIGIQSGNYFDGIEVIQKGQ